MLVDAVQSSRFITQKKSRALIQKLAAFTGPYHTELLCGNNLMGNIIDRFGGDVQTAIVDDRHFKVTVTVGLSNNFYIWVFASAGNIKILSPPAAIREFQQLLSQYL